MSHRDENRLTDEDHAAIAARMSEREAEARRTGKPIHEDDLVRYGVRAIGCCLYDLRDVEIAWVRACAAMVQAARRVNGVAA